MKDLKDDPSHRLDSYMSVMCKQLADVSEKSEREYNVI